MDHIPVKFEDEDEGDASPTLTFATRTPASLSPVTPFSGFFPPGESFEGPVVGVVGVEASQKQHVHAAGVAVGEGKAGVGAK